MIISNSNPTKIFNKKNNSCSDSVSDSSEDSTTDSSEDSSDSSDSYEGLDYDKNRLNNKNIEYRHKIVNERIDLMIDIFINLKDYLEGSCKTIKYIDNNYIKIDIPSFTLNNVIFNNKGLLGGNLVVNVILLNISKINWDKLIIDEKKLFIKTIENIYKN
jgi:hypothetical protein